MSSRRFWYVGAGLVLITALVAAGLVVNIKALAAGGSPGPATQTLSAAGPDTALNVDNSDMNKLLAALHNQGVQDKDIQTSTVYVNQQTSCCPQAVSGYTATNSVTATIHHLNNVGTVIAAVVDAVGNDVQLSGVNLSVADTSDAVTSARQTAIRDAQARATSWTSLAGRKLGKLLSLSEIVAQQPVGCSGGCGAGGGGVPIAAGQSQITVSITATYELD
jgi:uncharacterized protein YggE